MNQKLGVAIGLLLAAGFAASSMESVTAQTAPSPAPAQSNCPASHAMAGGSMSGESMQGGSMSGDAMHSGSSSMSGSTSGNSMQGGSMSGSSMQGGSMSGGSMSGDAMHSGSMQGGTPQASSGGNIVTQNTAQASQNGCPAK